MWTKIIHLMGLNKGQVEQMTWGSVGQAPLRSVVTGEVLQCLSTDIGFVLGDRLSSKDFAGLSFKSIGLMETEFENNSSSRCGFLFWKIMVFWCIWISLLQTSSVIPLQVCSWWRGTLIPQNMLLGQSQGILHCGGPAGRDWASASVPRYHVRTPGLLWRLGRYSPHCVCPGYLAQMSAISFLQLQVWEEQPLVSFCNSSSSARRQKRSFSRFLLPAEQSLLGVPGKTRKGMQPCRLFHRGRDLPAVAV